MAVGLFTKWDGQTADEWDEQVAAWDIRFMAEGRIGHIAELGRDPLELLATEAFHPAEGVPIPAAVLRSRLDEAIELATQLVPGGPEHAAAVQRTIQRYRDFVELCEQKERETGKPVTIIACY